MNSCQTPRCSAALAALPLLMVTLSACCDPPFRNDCEQAHVAGRNDANQAARQCLPPGSVTDELDYIDPDRDKPDVEQCYDDVYQVYYDDYFATFCTDTGSAGP